MSLTIKDDRRGDILVVHLSGRLDTATSRVFEDHLATHLGQGRENMIIDLGHVDYVNSYGLRVFLLMAKKLKARRDGLILCGLTPDVRKIFQISGFDKILTISDASAETFGAATGGAGG